MTPDQEATLLSTVARIDERVAGMKEVSKRHEQQLLSTAITLGEHDVKFARYKGGARVASGLFVGLIALLGLDFWSSP